MGSGMEWERDNANYEAGYENGKMEGAKEELKRYIDLLKKWNISQFNQMGRASGGMVYECVLKDLEKRLDELNGTNQEQVTLLKQIKNFDNLQSMEKDKLINDVFKFVERELE